MRRFKSGSEWGFTLLEALAAALVLGVVSLGALQLYTAVPSVQHRVVVEFDLRRAADQVLNELRTGFARDGRHYAGVAGAARVEVASSGRTVTVVSDGGEVVYAWDPDAGVLYRTVGPGAPERLLEGVRQFQAACGSGGLLEVEVVLAGGAAGGPEVAVAAGLRPRIAEPICGP